MNLHMRINNISYDLVYSLSVLKLHISPVSWCCTFTYWGMCRHIHFLRKWYQSVYFLNLRALNEDQPVLSTFVLWMRDYLVWVTASPPPWANTTPHTQTQSGFTEIPRLPQETSQQKQCSLVSESKLSQNLISSFFQTLIIQSLYCTPVVKDVFTSCNAIKEIQQ